MGALSWGVAQGKERLGWFCTYDAHYGHCSHNAHCVQEEEELQMHVEVPPAWLEIRPNIEDLIKTAIRSNPRNQVCCFSLKRCVVSATRRHVTPRR